MLRAFRRAGLRHSAALADILDECLQMAESSRLVDMRPVPTYSVEKLHLALNFQ